MGRVHGQEVDQAKKTHPLVNHFQETHNGQKQRVLMPVLKAARTLLEIHVWESVNIDRLSSALEEGNLNQKTESGQSKTPSLINKAETSAKAPRTNGGHQGKKRGDYEEDHQKNEEGESEREAENLEQRPSR